MADESAQLAKTDSPSLVKFESANLFIICFSLEPPLHCTGSIYCLRTEAQKKKKKEFARRENTRRERRGGKKLAIKSRVDDFPCYH